MCSANILWVPFACRQLLYKLEIHYWGRPINSYSHKNFVVIVQLLSCVRLFVTPWTAAHQAPLSFTISWSLLTFMSIELVMLSNYPILCCPLYLLPSVFPSIRIFSNKSTLHIRWPKHWNFIFSISPSNEYSGLISLRIDWFDLAIQGTLENLLQPHSSIASILQCLAFFLVQLSHPYMTFRKTIALTRQTFVCNVSASQYTLKVCHSFSSKEQASFNFVAAFTVRSDFGAQENKICHCFHFFPHLFAMKWWDWMPWS